MNKKVIRQKIIKVLKALFRPTKAQKKNQKQKLNRYIDRTKSGIDQFDKAVKEFSDGLKSGYSAPDVDYTKTLMGSSDREYWRLTGK